MSSFLSDCGDKYPIKAFKGGGGLFDLQFQAIVQHGGEGT